MALARAARQQLESLARAGLDRVPMSPDSRESSDPTHVHTEPLLGDQWVGAESQDAKKNQDIPAPEPGQPASPPAPAAPPVISSFTSELPPPSLSVLFHSSEFTNPPVAACDRQALLDALAREVSVCRRCPHLADTRTQTVFGTGQADTRLMFVGEAPGADEDRIGEPFVGRAGQLLTDMITKGMGLSRDQVYIANVLKCRPPGNRDPEIEETNNCFPYLEQQIEIIRPRFLCLLGRAAVSAILDTAQSMGKMRGRWHRYRGIPTIVTYHPAYLLRNPAAKKDAWDDLRMLMKEMGLKVPPRSQ